MNQATKEFRKNLADTFIKALSEKNLEWKKNWSAGAMDRPINAITGKAYKGINYFALMLRNMEAVENGMNPDNRWATFKQIQDKGWKVKKGSKACKVEYWQPYDFKEKKPITWEDLRKRQSEEHIGVIAKYYPVFNGRDIEGIPELEAAKERVVISDDMIQKISRGMDVVITNDGGDRAFYRPSNDSIHLPLKETFFSTYDYNTTALHELSHATGAKHRLNRNLGHSFGSAEYAYEELVAEISACFMGEHLQIEQTAEHIQNHKAYVQGWIEEIKEKPEVLVRAIRDAGNAANLLEYHAGILTQEEYRKSLQESQEVSEEKVQMQEQNELGFYTGPVQKLLTKDDYSTKSIEADLKANGFKPTKALVNRINELNRLTGKENGIKDIKFSFQEKRLQENPEARKVENSIVKMLQKQEMAKQPIPLR